MIIRPVEPNDFSEIAAITNHYILSTPIHFGYDAVTSGELRGTWCKNAELYPFVVACDEQGGVLGYAKAGVWRERAAYSRTAELSIYVAPGHHRRGIGRVLYSALIERCRAAGFHVLVGSITLPNDPSIRLHESLGFEHVGVFREVGWKFDAWHDVGFYQLMLSSR